MIVSGIVEFLAIVHATVAESAVVPIPHGTWVVIVILRALIGELRPSAARALRIAKVPVVTLVLVVLIELLWIVVKHLFVFPSIFHLLPQALVPLRLEVVVKLIPILTQCATSLSKCHIQI